MDELQHSEETAISSALDQIGVGCFLLNREGYLTDFNDTGSVILGVDHHTPWSDLHISNIERTLNLGIYENFETILNGHKQYIRKSLRGTNSRGHQVVVNICCLPITGNHHGQSVMGIIENINSREITYATIEEQITLNN